MLGTQSALLLVRALLCGSFILWLAGAGCSRAPAPLPPLAADQIPGELGKAFIKTTAETKALVDKVVSGLQAKDYPGAYSAIQTLCGTAALTKPQRALASRAMITINTLLQSAQAQGDHNATMMLDYQRKNK